MGRKRRRRRRKASSTQPGANSTPSPPPTISNAPQPPPPPPTSLLTTNTSPNPNPHPDHPDHPEHAHDRNPDDRPAATATPTPAPACFVRATTLREVLSSFEPDAGRHFLWTSRGLVNRANSCFLNAIVQACVACPPMLHLLQLVDARAAPSPPPSPSSTPSATPLPITARDEDGQPVCPTLCALVSLARRLQVTDVQQAFASRESSPLASPAHPRAPLPDPAQQLSKSARRRRRKKRLQAKLQPQSNPVLRRKQAEGTPTPSASPYLAHFSALLRSPDWRASSFFPEELDDVLQRFKHRPAAGSALGSQEDAHEFFTFLVDSCHEECVRLEGGSLASTASNDDDDDDGWEEVASNGKSTRVIHADTDFDSSVISRTIGGRMRTANDKRGVASSADSVVFQPFFALSLDVSPAGVDSLEAAIEFTLAEGAVSGTRQRIVQHTTLDRVAPILVFHVMRFAAASRSARTVKLDKFIAYPPHLMLHPRFLSGTARAEAQQSSSGHLAYSLRAVVVHHGRLASDGHYTTYMLRGGHSRDEPSAWLHADDDRVSHCSKKDALSQNAYLLFYVKSS